MNIYIKKLLNYDLPHFMSNLFSHGVTIRKVDMYRDGYENLVYVVVYEHSYEVF